MNVRYTLDLIGAGDGFAEYIRDQIKRLADYAQQYDVNAVVMVTPLSDPEVEDAPQS